MLSSRPPAQEVALARETNEDERKRRDYSGRTHRRLCGCLG